jgi:hypothetical protein
MRKLKEYFDGGKDGFIYILCFYVFNAIWSKSSFQIITNVKLLHIWILKYIYVDFNSLISIVC